VGLHDSDNNPIYEDEEGEIDEDELAFEKRAEVFSRAWAAWKVAEDTLADDPFVFGPQSFGLIALGLLLDVIKDATGKVSCLISSPLGFPC
jgi:RNA-dependent RNA polymerase